MSRPTLDRTGASIVELVVALTIITIGLVAISGTMTLNMRQAAIAEFRADQAAVRMYASERMRGLPYDSVTAGSTEISGITAEWTVAENADTKVVTLITGGPLVTAGLVRLEADTVQLSLARP